MPSQEKPARSSRIRKASTGLEYVLAKRHCPRLEVPSPSTNASINSNLMKSIMDKVISKMCSQSSTTDPCNIEKLLPFALASRDAYLHLQWHLKHATFKNARQFKFNWDKDWDTNWNIPQWLLSSDHSSVLQALVYHSPKIYFPLPNYYIDILAKRTDSIQLVVTQSDCHIKFAKLLSVLQAPPKIIFQTISEEMVQTFDQYPHIQDVSVWHYDDSPLPAVQKLKVKTDLFIDFLSNISPVTTEVDLNVECAYQDYSCVKDVCRILQYPGFQKATIRLFVDLEVIQRPEDTYVKDILKKVLRRINKSPIEKIRFTFLTESFNFHYDRAHLKLIEAAGFKRLPREKGSGLVFRKPDSKMERIFELKYSYEAENAFLNSVIV